MSNLPLDAFDAEVGGGTVIEVTGPTRSVAFAPRCLNCSSPASTSLRITKVFRLRLFSRPRAYRIYSLEVPLCSTCEALHRQEERPLDPDVRRHRLLRWVRDGLLPYTLTLAGLGTIIYMLGPPLIPLIARSAGVPAGLIWSGIAAFLVGLAMLFFISFVAHGVWGLITFPGGSCRSWHVRLERGPLGARLFLPVQPTEVVSAIDFSDDLGDILAGQRHRYWFRNSEVAAGFAEANASHIWDAGSPRARISFVVWRLLLALVILLVVMDELGPLVGIRLPFLHRR